MGLGLGLAGAYWGYSPFGYYGFGYPYYGYGFGYPSYGFGYGLYEPYYSYAFMPYGVGYGWGGDYGWGGYGLEPAAYVYPIDYTYSEESYIPASYYGSTLW